MLQKIIQEMSVVWMLCVLYVLQFLNTCHQYTCSNLYDGRTSDFNKIIIIKLFYYKEFMQLYYLDI